MSARRVVVGDDDLLVRARISSVLTGAGNDVVGAIRRCQER
jgi:AmiR/NasT family two-component response regulator